MIRERAKGTTPEIEGTDNYPSVLNSPRALLERRSVALVTLSVDGRCAFVSGVVSFGAKFALM